MFVDCYGWYEIHRLQISILLKKKNITIKVYTYNRSYLRVAYGNIHILKKEQRVFLKFIVTKSFT